MMSQNPFGAPAPGAAPEQASLPAESVTEKSHKGLLIGGLGGLVALVVAGGAFLVLSGDEVEPAPVAGAPVPAATSTTTTEPPAPLPTLAEFNGRNPFEAKIVEASGGGGGGEAAAGGAAAPAESTSTQPTTAPSGSTGGTGMTVTRPGGSGGAVVFAPGPAGPQGEPGAAGADGAAGVDGKDGEDGEDAQPASLWIGFAGVQPANGTEPEEGMFVLDIGDGQLQYFDVPAGTALAPADGPAPASWIKVVSFDGVLAQIQLGDVLVDIPVAEPVQLF